MVIIQNCTISHLNDMANLFGSRILNISLFSLGTITKSFPRKICMLHVNATVQIQSDINKFTGNSINYVMFKLLNH